MTDEIINVIIQQENTATERFSSAEFSKIARKMQEHHSLFYEMWHLGKPIFDTRIPTACITFDETGEELEYRINPEFWATLDDNTKCFVIGHESSHGVLNHGIRADVKIDANANKAMDLVVNHSLVNNFGFVREEIDPENKWCWIDTVLKDCPEQVKENESFEYYLRLVKKHGKGGEGGGNQLVDHHEMMGDSSKFLKKLGEKLSEKAKEELVEFVKKHLPKEIKDKKAGSEQGGMQYLVPSRKVKKKRKWETVIKKWFQRFLNMLDKDKYQWARTQRRFSLIATDLSIPMEMEVQDIFYDNKKILVWFFQDTSGSCADFKDRFFTAAETLPKDRFEVKMHCFDTRVYETTLASRELKGFGGTSFDCIEDYIQKYCREHGCKYPAAVFVVTDGYGNAVKPEKPKNWHWFLSEPYTQYIPTLSNWYNLKDYE